MSYQVDSMKAHRARMFGAKYMRSTTAIALHIRHTWLELENPT